MEKVYLYYMDKESKEIVSSSCGILCKSKVKNPKVRYISFTYNNTGSGYYCKVAPKPGEVKDFKGSTVSLWLYEDNKVKAYKCFKSYFGNKFKEDMEKMRRLIEETEEAKNGDETSEL